MGFYLAWMKKHINWWQTEPDNEKLTFHCIFHFRSKKGVFLQFALTETQQGI
jgi:hypothetical protein